MNESEVELFPTADTERYRTEWRAVQAGFVDDPEAAVRDADKLVGQVMDNVASRLAERRKELTTGATNGDGQRTEQLRVALRRYRSLFQQLTGLAATDNGHSRPAIAPPAPAQRMLPPAGDEKRATLPGDESPSDEKGATPPSDELPNDQKRVMPADDASEATVESGDKFVEHRADVADGE